MVPLLAIGHAHRPPLTITPEEIETSCRILLEAIDYAIAH